MNQNNQSNAKDNVPSKKSARKDESLTTIGELYNLRAMLREKGIKLKDEHNFKTSGL